MTVKKKILIVDDSSSNILLLQNFLEDEGFVIQVANSGKEAIKRLQDFDPDLILLDLMMPGLNGIDVMKSVPKVIPVIMISANKDPKLVEEAKASGIKSYIQKPIDFDEILNEIALHIA
jgi:two-component system, sensor histidine kinase and response regulator